MDEGLDHIPDARAEVTVRDITPADVGLEPSSRVPTAPPPTNLWPDTLPADALHGPVGEFVRIVEPHTETDSAALACQFLVGFGSVLGRGPHALAEADEHHANLFVVLVGATSKGRKGTSWGRTRSLFKLVDDAWERDRVQSGLSSGEGLIWAVRDPISKTMPIKKGGRCVGSEDVLVDKGIDDKRLLAMEAEFASTLRVLAREGNVVSATIRSAWDTGTLRSLTKNSPAVATGAHISIIGHVTQDELLRYLDRTEAGNGFGNRFLYVATRRSKLLPEGGSLPPDALDRLVELVRQRIQIARTRERLEFDAEARVLWHAAYPILSAGQPGLLGAMTARAEAHCLRLAMVYALLDGAAVIGIRHLRAAFGLWSYCEDSARCVFGSALGDPTADTLLAAIRRSPGFSRTAMRDLFQRNAATGEIDRALGQLLKQNLAFPKSVSTSGRPIEGWWPTTDTTNAFAPGGLSSFKSFLSSLPPLPPAPRENISPPSQEATVAERRTPAAPKSVSPWSDDTFWADRLVSDGHGHDDDK